MTDLNHKTDIVRLLEDNKCARKSLIQLSTQVHNLKKRVEILEKSAIEFKALKSERRMIRALGKSPVGIHPSLRCCFLNHVYPDF